MARRRAGAAGIAAPPHREILFERSSIMQQDSHISMEAGQVLITYLPSLTGYPTSDSPFASRLHLKLWRLLSFNFDPNAISTMCERHDACRDKLEEAVAKD